MSLPFFEAVDWPRPWYASVAQAAERLQGAADDLTALNQQARTLALHNHRGLPLSFVTQAALPMGTAYEVFISATGRVPTRANLHDFFNALVWLSFPRLKAQLNAMQAAQIERAGVGQIRGATRDAVTIFDENAALLVLREGAPGHEMAEALRNHEWQQVFLEQRSRFAAHAEVWLFGHALMEKLVTPYKAITAHTWVVSAPDAFFDLPHVARRAWLDEAVAHDLAARDPVDFNTRCFTPMPVSGVPDWWAGQGADFYADASVFRPKRVK
ncbi:hypothetical protein GCM10027046_03160 [Uliginosibacterium flavum]|uniref:DUF3025 domain-containing protein n=1 Tax=Uliginosibacterium flavum TaxID=1396831 RepID=A0ABV2TJK9_9RHOO